MKLSKQLFTFLTSAALLISAGTSTLVSASYDGDYYNDQYGYYGDSVPDWVPKNYIDALEFINKHGSTYVEGEYICIIQQRKEGVKDRYDISYQGSNIDENAARFIYSADLHFSSEDAPDKSDADAYEEYQERLHNEGIYEGEKEPDNYFRVEVFTMLFNDVDVTVMDGSESYIYTFANTSTHFIKQELDVFRFLPDSVEEFDAFIEKHGNLCAYDDYIVYCGDIPGGSGFSLKIEQNGTGQIKEMLCYDVEKKLSTQEYMIDDGPRKVVKLFKVLKTGELNVDIIMTMPNNYSYVTVSKEFKIETCNKFRRKYKIVENMDDLPDWIPKSFEEAFEFDGKYGATHIQDGYICCVRRMRAYGEDYSGSISCHSTVKDEDVDYRVSSKFYGTDIPEKPDKNDKEAYREYLEALNRFGLTVKDAENAYVDLCYSVDVFKPESSSRIDIWWDCGFQNTEFAENRTNLRFETDKDGNITETDLFSWVPDSVTEARKFAEKNGVVSVQNGYIVFCIASHGHYLETSQDGIPKINEKFAYFFDYPEVKSVDGGEYAQVVLYKGSKAGTAEMTFKYNGTVRDEITNYYRFDNDLNVSIIDADQCDPLIKGDCNYDGAFGISDVVTLQNWLIGDGKLKKAENSDVNGDGTVNVFDLVAMRKQLLSGNDDYSGYSAEPAPMLACIYQNHAWGVQQNVTIYDENGNSYSMIYDGGYNGSRGNDTYDKFIEMSTASDWYDDLVNIMKRSSVKKSRMPDEIVNKTRKFTNAMDKHRDDKLCESIPRMNDAGQYTIYLIGKDSSGVSRYVPIYTEGDCMSWSECAELQEYIKEMGHSSFIIDDDAVKLLTTYYK